MTKKEKLNYWNNEKELCSEIGYNQCDHCKRKNIKYLLTIQDGHKLICRNCCLKYLKKGGE